MLFSLMSGFAVLVFLALFVSVGFVFFYVAVNGLFDSFSDHHRRGYMAGVWQSAEDIGFAAGPILGGVIADFFGLRGAFFFFGFIFILSAIWIVLEKKSIQNYEIKQMNL